MCVCVRVCTHIYVCVYMYVYISPGAQLTRGTCVRKLCSAPTRRRLELVGGLVVLAGRHSEFLSFASAVAGGACSSPRLHGLIKTH